GSQVDIIEKNGIFWASERVGGSSERRQSQMGTQLSDFIKRKKGTVVDLTGFGTGLRRVFVGCSCMVSLLVVDLTGFGTGLRLLLVRLFPPIQRVVDLTGFGTGLRQV
ncbi:MAG: hypothetical protein D3904_15885, partial [Candidatus Electrothrix sp. EH2]|nr:hypothetical protein [Candidatus Electrothrix sp. EH2]